MWTLIQRWLPLLYTWFSATLALWIVDSFFETIWFDKFETLLISSLLLALVNTFIKPLLLLLTLPLAIFTLGLAIPLLNGLILMGVAEVVTGFQIGGYWVSVLAAFVMSIILFLINLATGQTRMRTQFQQWSARASQRPRAGHDPHTNGPPPRGAARPGAPRSAEREKGRNFDDSVIDVEAREKKDEN
ncbi:MAG: phage holin family protein [Burkholderiaceae bacterium]